MNALLETIPQKASARDVKAKASRSGRCRLWALVGVAIATIMFIMLQHFDMGFGFSLGPADQFRQSTGSYASMPSFLAPATTTVAVQDRFVAMDFTASSNMTANLSDKDMKVVLRPPSGPFVGRFLYVGVMSAPGNLQLRNQLRAKYVTALREHFAEGYVKAEFVVGHVSMDMRDTGGNISDDVWPDEAQRRLQYEKGLKAESDAYGDIVRIPSPEQYENLPDKTILLFARGVEAAYSFIVKIDDDQMLNIVTILEVLETKDPRSLLYGGNSLFAERKYKSQLGAQGHFAPYFGGPAYFLSWELAWRLTKINLGSVAAYMQYGSSSEDVDMGHWVERENRLPPQTIEYTRLRVATALRRSMSQHICVHTWLSMCLMRVGAEEGSTMTMDSVPAVAFVLNGNGTISTNASQNKQLCIDAPKDGGVLRLGICNESSRFEYCDDLTLRLKSNLSMCIGVNKMSLTQRAPVLIQPCAPDKVQQFEVNQEVPRIVCPSLSTEADDAHEISTQTQPTSMASETVAHVAQDVVQQVSGGTCLLYIGVLSKPIEFKRRAALRHAFVDNMREYDGVVVEFVIGHEHFWGRSQGFLATDRQAELEDHLLHEVVKYGDIIRVPVDDVDEHVQDKALHLFAQGVDRGCAFVAKVGDDRQLDINSFAPIFGVPHMNMLYYVGESLQLQKGQPERHFTGGVVGFSWQLAARIARLHVGHSAQFVLTGGRSLDADIGMWVEWEIEQGDSVHYVQLPLSTPFIDSNLNLGVEDHFVPVTYWRLRVASHPHLCWNMADIDNGGRMGLGVCGAAEGQVWSLPPDGTIRPLMQENRCLTLPDNATENPTGVLFFKYCHSGSKIDPSSVGQAFKRYEDGSFRPKSAPEFCIRVVWVGPQQQGGKVRYRNCSHPHDGFQKFSLRRA